MVPVLTKVDPQNSRIGQLFIFEFSYFSLTNVSHSFELRLSDVNNLEVNAKFSDLKRRNYFWMFVPDGTLLF